jgi:hypothetical protein
MILPCTVRAGPVQVADHLAEVCNSSEADGVPTGLACAGCPVCSKSRCRFWPTAVGWVFNRCRIGVEKCGEVDHSGFGPRTPAQDTTTTPLCPVCGNPTVQNYQESTKELVIM